MPPTTDEQKLWAETRDHLERLVHELHVREKLIEHLQPVMACRLRGIRLLIGEQVHEARRLEYAAGG